jgi:hypothetical protein
MKGIFGLGLITLSAWVLAGCAPEPGSERWCEMMRDTPRGDWSANDALEFAQSCVFNNGED